MTSGVQRAGELGRGVIYAALVLTLTHSAGFAQSPNARSSEKTVSQILGRMAENTKGLTSYEVPFHIDGHYKKSFISVRVPLDGTRYFKVPDKSLVKIPHPPPEAKELADVYSWLGTPQTWPTTYDISLEPTKALGVYELRATYKPNSKVHAMLDKVADSTVDHILLDVDARTFDPVHVTWFYHNGSTIVMDITNGVVDRYRLPQRESVNMNLPGHHFTALVTYGFYKTNVSIPDAEFSK
jgi:hypothetical protein